MNEAPENHLQIHDRPQLKDATLLLAFSGWMDGGDVSTGTVQRLVDLLDAAPIAEIDPEPFYIFNFPGSMEVAALFRPHIRVEDGLLQSIEMPSNVFYAHAPSNLILLVGKEPHLRWRTFRDCIFQFTREFNVKRMLFVGSFGGVVPHTREPRLYVTCSDPKLLPLMERYGVRRSGYEGPGSFTTYLLSEAPTEGIQMTSLVAEIPGYLQGTNPSSILAVTRRLATILDLSPNLDELRVASTEWELEVSRAVEQDEEMMNTVRKLEEEYDNQLLKLAEESSNE